LGICTVYAQKREFESLLDRLEKREMAKVEKKRKKLQERIDTLQEEMRISLTKKTSSTKEISLPEYQKKIQELQKELNSL